MEKNVIVWFQENRIQTLDSVFIFLTDHVTLITALVLAYLIFRVYVKKNLQAYYFYLPLSSLLVAALLTNLVKIIIQRPRPYVSFPFLDHPVNAGGFSFPSGHSAEVFVWFFIAIFLSTRFSVKILAFMWAVFIAYTRMAFGAHYPSDILGGVLTAFLSFIIALKILKRLNVIKS